MTDHAQDQMLQVHRRLDAQAHRLKSQEGRLDGHDGRIRQLETQQAVSAERAENIQKSLTKIEDGIGWANKLIIGGILAGVVGFLIRGGFNVG